MSEYQMAMVPKLMLASMDLLRPRLGLKTLTIGTTQTEFLTTGERAKAFGSMIEERVKANRINIQGTSVLNPELSKQFDTVIKTISIAETLKDSKFALLNEMVSNTITAKEKEILNRATVFIHARDTMRLNSISDDLNPLFERLNEKLKESHQRLKTAEKDYIKESTVKSLEVLGYSARIKERGSDTLVRGSKDGLSLAVQMKDDEVHIDMAGFEGGRCKVEMDRINQELSKHGIVFEIKKREHHGKKEGGVLAQAAEKEFQQEFNPLNEQIKTPSLKNNQRQTTMIRVSQLKKKLWR